VGQTKINTDQQRRSCFFGGRIRQIQQPSVATRATLTTRGMIRR
jgi:hypothetical protein